jgi:hypothetical protein
MDYEKIINELLERVSKLEEQVNGNKINITSNEKDKTKYLFNGSIYSKSRLVLAVIQKYVKDNRDIDMNKLSNIFDYTLIGKSNFGVVKPVNDAKKINGYPKRYYTKDDEVIHTFDGNMYVCTQWTIDTIKRFIARAIDLGFEIKSLDK